MNKPKLYVPLTEILNDDLPQGVVDLLSPVADNIAYLGGHLTWYDDTLRASLQLFVVENVALELPFLPGAALVLGEGVMELQIIGEGNLFNAYIVAQLLKLRFPRKWLQPVTKKDGSWIVDDDPQHFVEIDLPVGFKINESFDLELMFPSTAATTSLSLPPAMIGNTGVIIEAEGIQLKLSENVNLPTEVPGGDWRGVFIDRAAVYFTQDLDSMVIESLAFEDCYIGNGGFTGTIVMESDAEGNLFGVSTRLQRVEIAFKQTAVTRFLISASLELPYFDEEVDVAVTLSQDGNITAAIAAEDGLVTVRRNGVLEMVIDGFAIGRRDQVAYFILSGTLTPSVGDVDWPSVEIETLTIDTEGNVEIEGGWINLPDKYQLDFHGFQLELTQLGLGRSEDGGRWLGLNGGLQLVDGLPAGASVEGLRIRWDDDGLRGISFNGIGVEFAIDGVLRFDGEVAYVQDGDDHRFEGAIDLDLISLGMQIDAQLVVGRRQGYTYFAIYIGADLPAGIPLFTTGLALYGMAGLYAQHMEPGKTDAQQWYSMDRPKSWYHSGEKPGVAELSKWNPHLGSMAFGAGVTLGTASDNGYAFNGKLLLAILIPGPVILLEGQANLMKKRAELDAGEPNFRTLAVLDNREGSFLFGLDAQYKFDEKKGQLLDIRAGAEAFYSFSDPLAWYCYLGKKEPRDQRIAARMFNLFESTAYYMLDAKRLQVGAAVGYDLRKSAGPLRLELSAWLEAGASLNWMPPHFFGELLVHGSVRLSAFGVGLGLSVDALVAADIFDPFHLLGEFSVKLNLPWPLPDPEATITLEWGPIPDPPLLPLPLKGVAVEHFKTSAKWTLPRANSLGTPLIRPNYDTNGSGYRTKPQGSNDLPPSNEIPIVPLDSRPHLTFTQPVRDNAQVGVNPASVDWIRIGDPEKGEGPALARFNLDELVLEKREGGNWVTVAKSPSDDDFPVIFGSWAPVPPLPLDASATEHTDHTPVKLWLWSKNPFVYAVHAGREWEDWFLGENTSFPCIDVPKQQADLYDFEEALPQERLDVKHEGSERFWQSPDGVTFRWDERVFEIAPRGEIRLSRNKHRVFSRTVWRGREGVRHTTLERSILRVGRSAKRYVVESVVNNFFLDLDSPYNRVLMEQQETSTDYVFYVDPQIETVSSSSLISTCASELGLTQVLTFDFTPSFASPNAPNLSLTVELPRKYARVTLDLCIDFPTDLILFGFDGDEHLQAWAQKSISQRGRVSITVEAESIQKLCLHYVNRGKNLHILRIKGMRVRQETIDERQLMADHLQQETRRWEQPGNVLEPNKTYRLRIKTTVEARGEAELAGYEETLEQTEFAYFRTGGPPSVPATLEDGSSTIGYSVPIGHSNPSQFSSGLSDLRAYVEQTIPVTVTDDGGPSLQPRPVYRAYDVGVRFNEDYVELMYRQARRDLGLYVFDNNNRPIRDNRGQILPVKNHWGNTVELGLSDRNARWIETLNSRNCTSVSEAQIPHPSKLTARAHGQVLRPDTTHEARLVPLLLHETFQGILLHGWEVVHGQSSNWTLDRSTNLRGTVDHVDGSVVHLGDSPDLSAVTPGLHLLSFDPHTTGIRPAYFILAVNPESGTVTLGGRPDLIENKDYDYEITQPGPVQHTARTTGGGSGPLRPGALIARGEPAWSDYRFSVFARTFASSSTPTGSIGIIFRRQGNRYYRYALHAQPTVRRLTRVDGSSATVLAEEDFTYDANRDYQLTIEAVGKRIRIYQDGALVFDVTDDMFENGGIGLYAWRNDTASFRDVRVDDLRASAKAAYSFSFVTSRYANFYHHLHSYHDETWPATIKNDDLPSSDLAELIVASVEQANFYEVPGEREAGTYDTLIRHVLGAQSHTLPENVEITRIQHDATSIAWLIRTPEPIDWPRTALHIYRAHGEQLHASLPGSVKITDATFGQAADEGLTLLVRAPISIKGLQVQYRHNTAGKFIDDLQTNDELLGSVLLNASFNSQLSNDWTIVDEAPYSKRSSRWRVRRGELHQTENYYGHVGGMINAPGTHIVKGNSDWTDYRLFIRLRSDDDDAIGVIFRYTDRNNYYRYSMDRERAYRRLIKKEEGVVTVLWEDNKRYRRGKSYDLNIECQGGQLKASLDGAHLFNVTDSAHSSGRVGLYCRANKAARFEYLRVLGPLPEWSRYHVFSDTTKWTEGTVLRLHSTDGFTPTQTAEHYTANHEETDDLPLLSPYGTDIRLVSADGSILHKRHLFANNKSDLFSTTDLRLLRKADGTAFALVRPLKQGSVQSLDQGTYRLAFKFRRDNKNFVSKSIILRQNGDSSDEHATLDISWDTVI